MAQAIKKLMIMLFGVALIIGFMPGVAYIARAEEIPSLSATITLPAAGEEPDDRGISGDNPKYGINVVLFYYGDYQLSDRIGDTFEAGKRYRVVIRLQIRDGYTTSATTVKVNGKYTANYTRDISYPPGSKEYEFYYTVPSQTTPTPDPDPDNPGLKITKVTVSDIQVPVVWKPLDSSFSISENAAYEKEPGVYSKINWTKKVGDYTTSCTEGEQVSRGGTYYANISLLSKDKPFDAKHTIGITAYTRNGPNAVEHKVVDTTYKLARDNMEIIITLTFRACQVYDYTYEFTNAEGRTHGMPLVNELAWGYQDVAPNQYTSDEIDTLSLRWHKYGESATLAPQDRFQAGQRYQLELFLTDGPAAIIEPGTFIVYYDDLTGLYFEGELDEQGLAMMEPSFVPFDPVIHQVTLKDYSNPVIGDKVGDHKTVWADTPMDAPQYTLVSQTWYEGNSALSDSHEFAAGHTYRCEYVVRPTEHYSFDSTPTFALTDYSGNAVTTSSVQLQNDGTLKVTTENVGLIGNIETVRILDYAQPTVGKTASQCYPWINSDAPYVFEQLTWKNATDNVDMAAGDVFKAGKNYYLMFTVKAKSGYELSGDTRVEVTGMGSNVLIETPNPSYIPSAQILTGAVKTMAAVQEVTSLQVGGYRVPLVGSTSNEYENMLTVPDSCGYKLSYVRWVDKNYKPLGLYEPLQAGKQYSLCVMLAPEDGYFFNVIRQLASLTVTDEFGKPVAYQWEGAGDHAFGYYPGTGCMFFYTDWVTPEEPIDYVQLDLDEPAVGAKPDYTATYPSGAHYYSANELDAEDDTYLNDIMWDYTDVEAYTAFGVQEQYDVFVVITAKSGYAFPSNAQAIQVVFNGLDIGRYTANVETRAHNKLLVGVAFKLDFKFQVSFVNLGHGLTPQTQMVARGERAVEPEAPAEEGWVFKGWYTDAACTNPYDFSFTVGRDLTLFAKWEPTPVHTVSFVTNGGSAIASQSVIDGLKATKPANPTRSGYTFAGWYADAALSTAFDFSAPITADVKVYAKWNKNADVPKDSPRPAGVVSPENPAKAADVAAAVLKKSNEKDMKGSSFSLLKAKGVAKSKKSVKLTWKKVKGATSYTVYGNKCGKGNRYKKIKTVKKTSYTQKKRKKGTYYKYLVVATKGKRALAISKTIHVATKGGKVGNNTKVKLSKKKLSLAAGKSKKVKATLKKGALKVKIHRKVAYESDDVRIAKVSAKGKITGVSRGTCYVYAYAQNGVAAKVKVTVK